MHVNVLAVSLLAVLASALPAKRSESAVQSFAESCKNCAISSPPILVCQCTRRDEFVAASVLDLNTCLGNNFGYLQWKKGGRFWSSCTNATIIDGYKLQTTCDDAHGGTVDSVTLLNERIHNSDGVLSCSVAE